MLNLTKLLKMLTHPITIISMFCIILICYLYLDQLLIAILNTHNYAIYFLILKILTKFGNTLGYIIFFMIAGVFLHWKKYNKIWENRIWFLLLCTVISNIICCILKIVFGRARPFLWIHSQQYGFYWMQWHADYWSFPSGHTTTIMAVMLGLSIIFSRYYYRFIFIGIIIAISRVLLLQHYLSDVITATYLTIVEILIITLLIKKQHWLKGFIDE